MTAGPYGNVDSSEVDSSDTPAMKGFENCMAKVLLAESTDSRWQALRCLNGDAVSSDGCRQSCATEAVCARCLAPLQWNIIYLLYIPFTLGFLLYAGAPRAPLPPAKGQCDLVSAAGLQPPSRARAARHRFLASVRAGYRRNQMRAKFNIAGDEYEDYLYWCAAGALALSYGRGP